MAASSYRSLGNRSKHTAEAMPDVIWLKALYELGVTFRRGQLVMIAGRPGAGKSHTAMALASAWGLPTLYAAADMGEYVSNVRDASICTGLTSSEVSAALEDPSRKPWVVGEVKSKSVFRFIYDPMPSLQDIDEELEAYCELFDEFPAVIVVDNLMDLEPINEVEYASNKALLLELKVMARTTGSLVMAIHHNKEETNPAYPAPAKALQGKVSQTPELVLSVALDENIMRISPVKNRSGESYPTADKYAELIADPARTSFRAKPAYVPYVPPVQLWRQEG